MGLSKLKRTKDISASGFRPSPNIRPPKKERFKTSRGHECFTQGFPEEDVGGSSVQYPHIDCPMQKLPAFKYIFCIPVFFTVGTCKVLEEFTGLWSQYG